MERLRATAARFSERLMAEIAGSLNQAGPRICYFGVSFVDTNTGTAVGGSCAINGESTIVRTTDGGNTWITQANPGTVCLFEVSFTDANTGTAVGDGGLILRTTNGGDTWSPQTSGTTKTLYGVSFTDTNNGTISGFELGGTGIILRTTDGGSNWVEQTNYSLPQGANGFLRRILHRCEHGDYCRRRWHHSSDNQWRQSNGTANRLLTFNFLYGVSFTDANTGTAVGYENPDGMILRTTDGGNCWVRQNSGIGDPFAGINFFGVNFVNSNIGTIVGQDGIILRTTDGGSNWDATDRRHN